MELELANDALLARAQALASDSRRSTAELLELLVQVEDRQLHLQLRYPTLFAYCVGELKFSEGEAGNRVMAARADHRFPLIRDLLRAGDINLTTVRILGPHLTEDNHRAVLESARGRTRREVEEIVVRLAPRPLPPTTPIRRVVVAPSTPAPVAAPPAPAVLRPIAPEVYRMSITMSAEAKRLWTRLRELLAGDEPAALERALEEAVRAIEARRLSRVEKPREARGQAEHSRHVPAEIKRIVSARDGDRCAYVAPSGKRCEERRHLQFHHVRNWMTGGPTTVENLQLRCPAHNRYEADLFYAPLRAAAHGLNHGPQP